MKRLFWKLNKEANSYNLEPRAIPVFILELLRLPITILKFIINGIDNIISNLIRVKDKRINVTWKSDATQTDIKKDERLIYKQLLNNN
jgi:hypothetical protein